MELLQSQALVDWELSGSSASARHGTFDLDLTWTWTWSLTTMSEMTLNKTFGTLGIFQSFTS